jgi:hypothetical protein
MGSTFWLALPRIDGRHGEPFSGLLENAI